MQRYAAMAVTAVAILAVGAIDLRTSEETQRLYDVPVRTQELTPAQYERCLKHQPDYRTLSREIAYRSDGRDWVIECTYGDA